MIGLTSLFVGLRLYARHARQQRRKLPWGCSDVFVVLGWLSFVAQASMDTVLYRHGLFKPGIDPFAPEASSGHLDDMETALKIYYTENITYLNCMYCVKAAMLCLFHEFFPRFMKKTWTALIVTDVLVVLSFLAGTLLNTFYCFPINRNWAVDGDRYCSSFDQPVVLGVTVGSHIFTDLISEYGNFLLYPFQVGIK